MKRCFKITATILCLFVLTGCWDQKIYEKIGFILEVGIEKGDERDLLVTSIIPVIGGDSKSATDLLMVEANSMMQAIDTNNRISSKLLLGGRIQQILFSEDIAEKGINNIMNVMNRDTQNPILAYVAVVEGSPRDLMKSELQFKNKPRPGIYVNQLIKADIQHSYIPNTKIYNFDIDSFKKGKDPIAPLLKLRRDGIEAIGSALFSGDKMVGKIGVRETMILTAMQNKTIEDLRVHLDQMQEVGKPGPGEHTMSAGLKANKRKITVELKNNKPVINVLVNFDASVNEFRWNNLDDKSTKKKAEEVMSKEIKASGYQTLKYAQKVGSDPLGIGEIVRTKYNSYWKSVNWKEVYKNAEIHFDTYVTIKDIGDIK